MAPIIWTDVTDWDPSLTTSLITTNARTLILSVVNDMLNVNEFGGESDDRLKMARILLAAHFGELNRRRSNGASGAISSQSAGGLSRSYMTSGLATREFGTTNPGQLFLAMLRASPARSPRAV